MRCNDGSHLHRTSRRRRTSTATSWNMYRAPQTCPVNLPHTPCWHPFFMARDKVCIDEPYETHPPLISRVTAYSPELPRPARCSEAGEECSTCYYCGPDLRMLRTDVDPERTSIQAQSVVDYQSLVINVSLLCDVFCLPALCTDSPGGRQHLPGEASRSLDYRCQQRNRWLTADEASRRT
jgi:hypothetical protein